MKTNEELLLAIMVADAKSEKFHKKHMKQWNRWWKLTAQYAERIMEDNDISKGDSLFVEDRVGFQKIYEVRRSSFPMSEKGVLIGVGVPGIPGVQSWSLTIRECLEAKELYKAKKLDGTL